MPHILHLYYKSSKLFFKQQKIFFQFVYSVSLNVYNLLLFLSAIFDGIEWQSGFQPLMTFNGSAL